MTRIDRDAVLRKWDSAKHSEASHTFILPPHPFDAASMATTTSSPSAAPGAHDWPPSLRAFVAQTFAQVSRIRMYLAGGG